jgi:hypothetical protein
MGRLLQTDFPGRDQLLEQLRLARVRRLDENGSLEFEVRDDQPLAQVLRRIPIEAETVDSDGITMHLLLHVVDGRLKELEVYKEDSSAVVQLPDPSDLEMILL